MNMHMRIVRTLPGYSILTPNHVTFGNSETEGEAWDHLQICKVGAFGNWYCEYKWIMSVIYIFFKQFILQPYCGLWSTHRMFILLLFYIQH